VAGGFIEQVNNWRKVDSSNMVKLVSNMVNMVKLALDDVLLHLIVFAGNSFGVTYF